MTDPEDDLRADMEKLLELLCGIAAQAVIETAQKPDDPEDAQHD